MPKWQKSDRSQYKQYKKDWRYHSRRLIKLVFEEAQRSGKEQGNILANVFITLGHMFLRQAPIYFDRMIEVMRTLGSEDEEEFLNAKPAPARDHLEFDLESIFKKGGQQYELEQKKKDLIYKVNKLKEELSDE